MTILLRQKPLPQVVRQIVQRDNGAWFDPEDMSTMYQDSTGTTPVTAVEQPVGLMLDKSRGMMLGAEEVPVDYLSNTLLWTVTNGTSQAAEGKITFTASGGGTLLVIISGSSSGFKQGKYRITGLSQGITVDRYFMGRAINNTATVGDQTCVGYQRNAELFAFIVYSPPVGATFSIEQLSVRELYGYHATQSITASRPVLSARYNLLTKTEDFSDAVWAKQAAGTATAPVVTNNYGVAPDGSITAARLQLALNGGTTTTDRSCLLQQPALISGAAYASTFWVKSNTAQSYVVQQRLGMAAQNITIDQTWRAYTYSQTAASDNTHWLALRGAQGTSDSADILIWHPQLVIGTTLGPYQRVNTATDYDSVGFPKYIKAEGVDDHFVLPYLGLYNNASCSIIASHSSSSQAANGVIVSEASSTDADTKYLPYRQLASAGNVDSYIAADNAAVILDSTGAAYSGTKENIIESIIDSGTSIETYRSGVLLSNEPYTRSATLTLNNTTLFGSVSTTNTNFLNTKLYGLIITKSNLSARDRSLCETYLKSKVQVLQV